MRNRLAVLVPDSPGNYFDLFQIVPPALYDKLRQTKIVIHNWHKLGWDTDEQIARRRSVDTRGAKSDEAYVREVLGGIACKRSFSKWLAMCLTRCNPVGAELAIHYFRKSFCWSKKCCCRIGFDRRMRVLMATICSGACF